jgi:IMP dehydrogenase
MKLHKALCFDDVLIKPQYSNISSRKEISTKTNLGSGLVLKVPLISSPMDTVTERSMATKMAVFGGIGIIHRYNSEVVQAEIVKHAVKEGAANVGIAVGVGDDAVSRAKRCVIAGANLICVDVAHGHHELVEYTLKILRNTFGTTLHIMAGNVATPEAHEALSAWGADSVRVGIGGGSICSTRIQTGHGMPTLQSIFDCAHHGGTAAIIADGGIRNSGDIVKCLAAGADAVMLGSLLAGTIEAPGELTRKNGESIKVYRGMASKDAQIDWRGHYSSDEGVTSYVKSQGPVEGVITGLVRGIRSGLSYSGCRTIPELHQRSKFVQQTPLGNVESGTHILSKDR